MQCTMIFMIIVGTPKKGPSHSANLPVEGNPLMYYRSILEKFNPDKVGRRQVCEGSAWSDPACPRRGSQYGSFQRSVP